MGTSSSAQEWTTTRQMVAPTATVKLSSVKPDSMYTEEEWPEIHDFDRCYGVMRISGVYFGQVGFHFPVGKLVEGETYNLGNGTVWIKGITGRSFDIVLGEHDPVADVVRITDEESIDLPS